MASVGSGRDPTPIASSCQGSERNADGLAGGLADRLADGVEQAAKIRLAQAAHALDVDVLLLAGGEERPAWCLPADLAPPAGR